MGNPKYSLKSVVICLAIACGGALAAPADIYRLAELTESGRHDEAYGIASNIRAQHEGEPDFDLYYGISSIDSGHIEEGVFALERVIAGRPNHHRARLELARGQLLLGDKASAKENFKKVLAENPPQNVRARINSYLSAIQQSESESPKRYSAYLSASVGHDSNVTSGPSDAEFYSPLLGVGVISDSGLESSDNYLGMGAGVRGYYSIDEFTKLVAGADIDTRRYSDRTEYNTNIYSAHVGVVSEYEALTSKATLFHQGTMMDGDAYRNITGIGLESGYAYSKSLSVAATARYFMSKYPDMSDRDSATLSGGLFGQYSSPNGRFSLFGGPLAGRERPENDNDTAKSVADRTFIGSSLGANYLLTSRLLLRSSLDIQNSEYRKSNILFGESRRDKLFAAGLGATFAITKAWNMSIDYNYSHLNSNFPTNEFKKHEFSAGTQYNF